MCWLYTTVCPSGFTYAPEADGCYQPVLQSLQWSAAGNACLALNPAANLAVITSAQQNDAVVDLLQATCPSSNTNAG